MGYYKSIAISIQEAIEKEVKAGFESNDEFKEVMKEIASEYNTDLGQVYGIYFDLDLDDLSLQDASL